MAIFYPKEYNKLKVDITTGELYLLKKLEELSDDYDIFFNAYLNILRPDIVILKKGYGVLIIEVKDWNLNNYDFSDPNIWKGNFKIGNGINKPSPLKQVVKYKNEFFDIYISSLLEIRIKNTIQQKKDSIFGLIQTGIFLYGTDNKDISIINSSKLNTNHKYTKVLNETNSIKYYEINKKNQFFTDEIYNEFKRFLQPNTFIVKQIDPIDYKPEQKKLMISSSGQLKISGFPGSGKTIVLAGRAKKALDRHGGRVLILTYNITLRKYIEQKIKNIGGDLNRIIITNYHHFIGLTGRIKKLSDYTNLKLFENNDDKYDTILIDEIQDYEKEWVQIIKNYFLKDNGEFVVFGDEKQKIYDRKLDENKKPYTGIGGAWNKLKTSFRVENEIGVLANEFQKVFFEGVYEYDEIPTKQLTLDTLNNNNKESYIDYFYIEGNAFEEEFYSIFTKVVQKLNIQEDDICVLGTEIEEVRNIEYYFRRNKKKNITTFETKEIFDLLFGDKEKIKSIERSKKFHFWPHPGILKMSTIHSFKGWEINTVFLILDKDCINNELIYTGITRTKDNLIIINLGNKKYNSFFERYRN